ncbi:MAG: hypothetical protein ABWX71_01765 [Aeromicrobium sp.]
MYPSDDARQLGMLLRISRRIDIVGDVSVSVDDPAELLAWANTLPSPQVIAWRGLESDRRYVQVSATHHRSPIHGTATAVLICDGHRTFWEKLIDGDEIDPGTERSLRPEDLAMAWEQTPLEPPMD